MFIWCAVDEAVLNAEFGISDLIMMQSAIQVVIAHLTAFQDKFSKEKEGAKSTKGRGRGRPKGNMSPKGKQKQKQNANRNKNFVQNLTKFSIAL